VDLVQLYVDVLSSAGNGLRFKCLLTRVEEKERMERQTYTVM